MTGATDLDVIVERLCEEGGLVRRDRSPCAEPLPSPATIHRIVEDVRAVLFPGHLGDVEATGAAVRYHVGSHLDRIRRDLRVQVKRSLCFACPTAERAARCDEEARDATEAFLGALPDLRDLAETDVRAAYEGDPAATSPEETIFCYPGVEAVTCQRIAHRLHGLGVPLLPRIVTERAHGRTGIDIHPGAEIGPAFFIDHGTGVVIGETCRIGRNVRLYQGVTLGAKSFPLDEEGHPVKGVARHPVVEDDVTIYAGATVLGRITIGRGATIGGNVWVTRSVAPGAFVTQVAARRQSFADGAGI